MIFTRKPLTGAGVDAIVACAPARDDRAGIEFDAEAASERRFAYGLAIVFALMLWVLVTVGTSLWAA